VVILMPVRGQSPRNMHKLVADWLSRGSFREQKGSKDCEQTRRQPRASFFI
jgi:hypothetical protein